jgi:hypothetical protein
MHSNVQGGRTFDFTKPQKYANDGVCADGAKPQKHDGVCADGAKPQNCKNDICADASDSSHGLHDSNVTTVRNLAGASTENVENTREQACNLAGESIHGAGLGICGAGDLEHGPRLRHSIICPEAHQGDGLRLRHSHECCEDEHPKLQFDQMVASPVVGGTPRWRLLAFTPKIGVCACCDTLLCAMCMYVCAYAYMCICYRKRCVPCWRHAKMEAIHSEAIGFHAQNRCVCMCGML